MDSASTGCGDGTVCNADTADTGRVQGVCPNGWHLPSQAELQTLVSAVGGRDVAGSALLATSGWHNNGNGTDDFGFSALPSGYGRDGNFTSAGLAASFWSSSGYINKYNAYAMHLDYPNGNNYGNTGAAVNLGLTNKIFGFAVRCLRD